MENLVSDCLLKLLRGKRQWVRVQPEFQTSPVSPLRIAEDFHAQLWKSEGYGWDGIKRDITCHIGDTVM